MDLTLADLNDGARSWPSVERRVSESTDVWARDLRSVFEHAKDRFGDVSWESEEGSERIWGHKAMIYARAPKAFKDRYFITRPFARSPTSLRSPSPSSNFAPPSPYPPSFRLNAQGRSSSLSVDTLRPPVDSSQVLRLTHGDTPELFAAQLEWLYTGEGFGDVVEWISAEDDSGLGASIRDSLGRRGNQAERQDKLGQDLTYMWRSKLYADVRIHLAPIHELDAEGSAEDSLSDDSEESTDSLSSTAVFTAHKFILASRSPYFASLLLNTAAFKPLGGSGATADIHLPTPPFTPAALHFCLGYMYAGHLDFSNRTFDLLTAFQIHRAAAYLQLDTLTNEIEARIAHDFCHGLDLSKCHCRRCPMRAARVWRFASEPDVGAVALAKRAREYVLRGWGESWGKEVGSADQDQRNGLVRDTIARIGPGKVVSAFKAIAQVQARMEAGIRARAREAAAWVDPLQEMLEKIQEHTRTVLLNEFAAVAEAGELWQLALGKGFNDDLLDILVKEIVDVVGTPRGCVEGPRVYQALVSSIILKTDPRTSQPALPPRSRGRQQIEVVREGVLAHIRRRWMQIRDGGGFQELDNWALKEISDEIDVSLEDLLAGAGPSTPRKATKPVTLKGVAAPRLTIPRTTSTRMSLADSVSVRSTATGGSRLSQLSRPSTVRAPPTTLPPEPSGLKRLRLSSSASTNSVTSTRSVPITTALAPAPVSGPSARSPTAAQKGALVTIGSSKSRLGGTSSPTPSSKATTSRKPMSGPPRPLLTKSKATPEMPSAPTLGKAPSVSSIRTTKTARSTISPTPAAKTQSTPSAKEAESEAGPSRLRTTSASTTASVRTRATSMTPSVASRVSAMNKAAASRTPSAPGRTPPSLGPVVARTPGATRPSTQTKPPTKTDTPLRPKSPSTASVASTRSRLTSTASRTSTISKASTITRNTATPPIATPRSSRLTPMSKASNTPDAMRPSPVPGRAVPRAADTSKTSTNPSATGGSRLRTISTLSTTSKASIRPRQPLTSMHPTKQSLRSPSSSTDDAPEASTPLLSNSMHIEPIIRREGSDGSDMLSRGSQSPVKQPPPPPVSISRAVRKVSTTSTRSTASNLRPHPASAFDPPPRSLTPPPLLVREPPEGTKPFQGAGVQLHVGIPCIVSLEKKRARFKAAVKYIGHLADTRGPWVGIEVEDLERFGIDTLPNGSLAGTHYFHLTLPSSQLPGYDIDLDARQARLRRIDVIRDSLSRTSSKRKISSANHGLGVGLGMVAGAGVAGEKRSPSPFVQDWQPSGEVRALFVRPSEVVYILGAE